MVVAAFLMPWPDRPALGHSLDDLESGLLEREPFVEIVQRPAPGFDLRDAEGKPVRLADFRGKVVVLYFIYATCADLCPPQSAAIADVQEMVNQTPMGDQVEFIAITTDPARDGPNVLRTYGAKQGLDPANFTFLTSGPDQAEETRTLARLYGLKFTATKDGEQIHAAVTHVIDKEGALRARYHGLNFKSINLVMQLNALVNDFDAHASPSQAVGRSQGGPVFSGWLLAAAAIVVIGLGLAAFAIARGRRGNLSTGSSE